MSYSFHSLLFTFSLRLSHFFHCLSLSFTSFTFVHWLSITFTFVTVFTFVHQLKLPSPVSLLVCHLFTSWPPLGRLWSNGIDCFDLSLSLSSTVVQFKFPSPLSPSLTSLTVFHLCHSDLSLWFTFCHQWTNFDKVWSSCSKFASHWSLSSCKASYNDVGRISLTKFIQNFSKAWVSNNNFMQTNFHTFKHWWTSG